ncbi:hypothetical protein ZOSMA_197G00230 [Zostera marina]|uniref:Ribonuclease n=1 Tax=Zostera marina TaxID=29655 RepID=A0A0K9PR04_ZOSMR|nr:hypothetical protein ZOSMA_197G00230 [Zostera marina]
MDSESFPTSLIKWSSDEPCIMGIDEAGRGPSPMVYGCMYCPLSYKNSIASLEFADSNTLKVEKREELFEDIKLENCIRWEVDVIDPRELSSKMLKKTKMNLNEISHNSAMGLIRRVLDLGVILTKVYLDTVENADKYRVKISESFPGIKIVV